MIDSNHAVVTVRGTFLARTWERIPIVVRAVIAGFAVLVAGNFLPQGLIAANIRSPAVPWSAAAVAVYLSLYWLYLRGGGWPRSTAAARRQGLRAVSPSPRVWRWSLAAGGLGIGALTALTYMLAHLMPLGLEGIPDALLQLPAVTVVVIIITVSVMAGIVEEAAFRGYMQGPIEKRHGPVVAILVVSVVFAMAHFPGSVAAAPRTGLIVMASVGYGILAYLTGSILPGLVLHAAQDILGATLLWRSTRGGSVSAPPSLPGASDPMFLVECVATLVLGGGTVWAFRQLATAVKGESRRSA
jgi:membrane protease YdiL (CAAX protease family)